MAELEMLPTWAGRLAEPTHPPQPPSSPRRHPGDQDSGHQDSGDHGTGDQDSDSIPVATNGDAPAAANGHGPSVLAGQPPLPSGEHRLEPASATTTRELPVVLIPFEDETTPPPDWPEPASDRLVDTMELAADGPIEDAGLGEGTGRSEGAELMDDPALAAGAPLAEGPLDGGDQGGPATDAHLDEVVVLEPDQIELGDTDPIVVASAGRSPAVAPITTVPLAPADDRATDDDQPAERHRPALRVLGFLTLALLVVAAGVAAGYLFVALTGS